MSLPDQRVTASVGWSSRPVQPALSAACLEGLLEQTRTASDGVLFTSGPAVELDAVARWQRLEDLAWCGKVRALKVLWDGMSQVDQEFGHDEVALALGVGGMTAGNVLHEALTVSDLPGLLPAVEDARLSVRHVRAVLRTLRDHPDLTPEQCERLVTLLLVRLDGTQTPGQLSKLLTRLALSMDLQAAEKRKRLKDADRAVHFYPAPDGQAVLHATGPAELIAMVRASLEATLPLGPDPVGGRSRAAREFDLFLDLLTGSQTPGRWHASVIVPFQTATGGGLELADLPGLGPILPSTARDLLLQAASQARGVSRITVDEHGTVLTLDTPTDRRAPAASSAQGPQPAGQWAGLQALLDAFTTPPEPEDLGTASYRIPDRLRKYVQARDSSCVFPGCDRPAQRCDLDHRDPWPGGSTSHTNLHCLCRHHHRAKQASFTPRPGPDGSTLWTTRGGWQFLRLPHNH